MTFDDWIERKNFWTEEDFHEHPGLKEAAQEDIERTIKSIKKNMDGEEPYFVQTVSNDEFKAMSHGLVDMAHWELKPLLEWMDEHMSGKWYRYDLTNFMFADEADAIIFELVWG